MITHLLFAAAFAQEPDIEIDLGGPEEAPLSYNGGFTTRSADKVATNAAVSVSSPVGTTTVYCTDTEYVEARVDYALSGPAGAPLEAYGKSFKVATTGGTTGKVTILAGTRGAGVKTSKVTVTVNVPKQARLTVSAGGDWVKVIGCDGTVSATSKTSAYVGGPLDGFNVTANNGNIVVEVEGDSKIVAASTISAPHGDVTLSMPFAQDLKIDARGTAVTVAQSVTGTNDAAVVSGAIGAGGPALTIKASGTVTVKTP